MALIFETGIQNAQQTENNILHLETVSYDPHTQTEEILGFRGDCLDIVHGFELYIKKHTVVQLRCEELNRFQFDCVITAALIMPYHQLFDYCERMWKTSLGSYLTSTRTAQQFIALCTIAVSCMLPISNTTELSYAHLPNALLYDERAARNTLSILSIEKSNASYCTDLFARGFLYRLQGDMMQSLYFRPFNVPKINTLSSELQRVYHNLGAADGS